MDPFLQGVVDAFMEKDAGWFSGPKEDKELVDAMEQHLKNVTAHGRFEEHEGLNPKVQGALRRSEKQLDLDFLGLALAARNRGVHFDHNMKKAMERYNANLAQNHNPNPPSKQEVHEWVKSWEPPRQNVAAKFA